MPEFLGHLAMGLLFALPAWMLWDGRTAVAFVGFVLATCKLPDVDLVLQNAGLPVQHHGVTHTVVFVAAFSVVVGAVAVALLRPALQRWWRLSEDETVQTGTVYLFVTGGLILGGVSHLFADTLTADTYQPIEPLWPLFEVTYPIHAVHYTSVWMNLALLVVAATLHILVVASGVFPLEHRLRSWKQQLGTGENDRESVETDPDRTNAPSGDARSKG